MAIPTIETLLTLAPPVYVRKLYRKSNWGHKDDPINERVASAVLKTFEFDVDSTTYSLYLVKTEDDLRRIAVGLNGNRDSLTENIDLVAFAANEFADCGINIEVVAGETKCLHANRCHIDVTATHDQLTSLCRAAMEAERPASRLTKSVMREIVGLAMEEGCHAAVEKSSGCRCES